MPTAREVTPDFTQGPFRIIANFLDVTVYDQQTIDDIGDEEAAAVIEQGETVLDRGTIEDPTLLFNALEEARELLKEWNEGNEPIKTEPMAPWDAR